MDGSKPIVNENRAKNTILIEWNSPPNSFEIIKRFAVALLSMFDSIFSCESLFLHMKFIKSGARNCLGSDNTAAHVKLKTSHYQLRITRLAETLQQQIYR